jgi:hypothetical protein
VLKTETNIEINSNILLILGKLNYYDNELTYNICSESILSIIQKVLSEKNCPNDEILICISDLLNNKTGFLGQYILQMIDLSIILPKIFKTPLTNGKNQFLIALINSNAGLKCH